jgi:hypothetical protein
MVSVVSESIIAFCPSCNSITPLKQADRPAGEDLLSARTLLQSFPGIIRLIPRFVCAYHFTPLQEKESS